MTKEAMSLKENKGGVCMKGSRERDEGNDAITLKSQKKPHNFS